MAIMIKIIRTAAGASEANVRPINYVRVLVFGQNGLDLAKIYKNVPPKTPTGGSDGWD